MPNYFIIKINTGYYRLAKHQFPPISQFVLERNVCLRKLLKRNRWRRLVTWSGDVVSQWRQIFHGLGVLWLIGSCAWQRMWFNYFGLNKFDTNGKWNQHRLAEVLKVLQTLHIFPFLFRKGFGFAWLLVYNYAKD